MVPPRGYVELPYTLPQDSTLFLILRESSPALWTRKLDWIFQRGGMALVNVHPDYLRFEGEPPSDRTFPVSFYRHFLEPVRNRYAGSFWPALPRQAATFVRQITPPLTRRRGKRVCVLTHSYYESDQRVIRYADALAERGDEVEVLALQRAPEVAREETIRGVRVFRLQRRYGKDQTHQWSYLLPLIRFLLRASIWIARQSFRHPYDLLHVHNVPDFLVFAALYPRLRGARVILDVHDIVPEFYASKFGAPRSDRLSRQALWMEAAPARMADHVIIANHLWLDKYATRTRTEGRCSVFINDVDTQVFCPRPRRRSDHHPILIFPGGLQWHQGVDIAIRALKQVLPQYPQAELHIYGDGNVRNDLMALAGELGLNGEVRFHAPLPVRQIADVMADADVGVVPKRADSFGNEAFSTKILEFMALGVPVVVSSTRIDRYYFDDSVVRFFESGNSDALAEAILDVLGNEALRQQMIARASAHAARNSWQIRKADYLRLVDDLCERRI